MAAKSDEEKTVARWWRRFEKTLKKDLKTVAKAEKLKVLRYPACVYYDPERVIDENTVICMEYSTIEQDEHDGYVVAQQVAYQGARAIMESYHENVKPETEQVLVFMGKLDAEEHQLFTKNGYRLVSETFTFQ